MLYQGFLVAVVLAAANLISRGRSGDGPSGRANREGEGRLTWIALSTAAASHVALQILALLAEQAHQPIAILFQALSVFGAALTLPLAFICIKQYTNLALPQWPALRAFAIGVPLVLSLNEAAALLSREMGTASNLPSSALVAWTFGLLCILASGWRFVSTPRGRTTLTAIVVAVLVASGADAFGRFTGALWLGLTPLAWVMAAQLIVAAVVGHRWLGSRVRPVSRSNLVDQVRDGVLVLDQDHRILDYNRVAAECLCAGDSNLVGASAPLLLPGELVEALGDQEEQSLTLSWPTAGKARWLEVQIKPLLVDGEARGELLTLRDVTRRHQAEAALRRSEQALQEANRQLEMLAHTDPLTTLHNRRFFMERMHSEIERHSRSGLTLGLLLLDLDHFKQINDNYGHPMGDQVLMATAACLKQTVRETDLVARIGGEEFAVLLVDAAAEGPTVLAERIRRALTDLALVSDTGVSLNVTASIGALQFSGGMVDADTLLKLADQALYRAKEDGRDRVERAVYQPLPLAAHNLGNRRRATQGML